jgi:hypothetical protein
MGVRKKGNFWTTCHESPWSLPEINDDDNYSTPTRMPDHARGAEDRNARAWTNTEGRCRRVARGKTKTRGTLYGGRHAPGATRIRTAEQAAHAGSIRVVVHQPREGDAASNQSDVVWDDDDEWQRFRDELDYGDYVGAGCSKCDARTPRRGHRCVQDLAPTGCF